MSNAIYAAVISSNETYTTIPVGDGVPDVPKTRTNATELNG